MSGREKKKGSTKPRRLDVSRSHLKEAAKRQLQTLAAREELDKRREHRAAKKQAKAVAAEADLKVRRVQLVLDSVSLSGERDPLVGKGNLLRFLVVVTVAFDSQRSIRTRIPQRGTGKQLKGNGKRLLAKVGQRIFDGQVGEGEVLVIDIRPLPEDGGGGQHVAGRLRHIFEGDVEGWNGVHSLTGKFRPEGSRYNVNWRVRMLADVAESMETIARPDPGENIDHARFADEWALETFGPPGKTTTVRRVRAQIENRISSISEFIVPSDNLMAKGAKRGLAFVNGKTSTRLYQTKNPTPQGSFGYCSKAIHVSSKSTGGYADIIFPLGDLQHVERNTIRMFHWDRTQRAWQIVPASAAHPQHAAVWGRTRLRGTFIAVGMPTHPAIRITLALARQLAPLVSNADAAGVGRFTDPLCRLILCAFLDWHAGIMEGPLGELEMAQLDRDPSRARAELETLVMDWRRQTWLGELGNGEPGEPPREVRQQSLPTVMANFGGSLGGYLSEGMPSDICERCFGVPDLGELPEVALQPIRPPWEPTWPPPDLFYPPPPVYGINPCERWENIGPTFPSSVIRDVAVDPDNSNVIYAGTQRGGVWKTFNGGNNWAPLTDHLPNLQAYGFAVARKKKPGARHRTLYVAMIENDLGEDFDLFASDNQGRHWERRSPVPGAEGGSTPLLLATGKDNAELLYLCTRRGLFKSIDGGRTWITKNVTVDGSIKLNLVSLFDGVVWQVKLDPNDDNIVWIAVRNVGILVSRDAGDSWTLTTQGVSQLSGPNHMRIDVGQDAGRSGGNFVVAAVGGTVAYTENGGNSWQVVPPAPDTQTYSGWCSAVAVCPSDERIIILGTLKAQKTNNIKATNPSWSTLPGYDSWAGAGDKANWHADIQAVTFDPNDANRFFLATDGGVTRTNLSGSVVQRISDGIVTCQHFFMDVSQTGPFQAGASTYHTGIVKKRPSSRIWDMIGGNEGGIYRIDPRNSNIHFKSPWGGGISRSTTGGNSGSWAKPAGFTTDVGDSPYVTRLEIAPAGPQRVWAGTFQDRLFVSTDGGANFSPVKDSSANDLLLDGLGGRNDGVSYIAFAPSKAAVVYVGTKNGRIWKTTSAALSASGWFELPSLPKPPTTNGGSHITSIAVKPNDSNTLYVSYNRLGQMNVFRSTDGGASWEPATGALPSLSLPQLPVVDLWFDPGNPNRLFAALEFGVYTTHDAAGDWWEPFSEGLPRASRIAEMRVRRNTRTLYLATSGRGIWQRKL